MREPVNPYDMIPYQGAVVANSAPSHLSLCSLFHQGPIPKQSGYRVMELGCGDGANLLALAFYRPDAYFIGVDYSGVHIEKALRSVGHLGLTNIEFKRCDVRDLSAMNHTPYDYILAHGLFSWIPDDARRAVLAFCRDYLASEGLAYILYNAMPGWAMRGVIRDTFLRSPRVQAAPLEDKAGAALELSRELLEDLPSRQYAYGAMLARELEFVQGFHPSYIHHEFLSEVNQPFWLREFVELAGEYQLGYVADAHFCREDSHAPQALAESLKRRPMNGIQREETADLLCDRYLRASIVCKDDARRTSHPRNRLLDDVYLATSLSAKSDPFDLREGVTELFEGIGGIELTLDSALTKAAVLVLSERWPWGLKFSDMAQAAEHMVNTMGMGSSPEAAKLLKQEILEIVTLGQLELRLEEPIHGDVKPSDPVVHELARYEAGAGTGLTSSFHRFLPFDEKTLGLVRLLDRPGRLAEIEKEFDQAFLERQLSILSRWGLLKTGE